MAWIRFKDFELNEQTYELRKDSVPVKIQMQPARVLALLVANRGALVSRAQIRIAIWGEETFVDFERGLNFCIRQIRLVLNDNAENPKYLETLPRLGYRCIAPIEPMNEEKVQPARSRLRIAILPIGYLQGDVDDYFTIGLTEDMISALSRLDSEKLRVVMGPHLNFLIHHQPGFLVGESPATFYQFTTLSEDVKCNRLGRGVWRSASKNWHSRPWRSWKDMYTLWVWSCGGMEGV